jgi:hypothetical protein
MTTPRRDFLSWLGASGAFAAMPNLPATPHATPDRPVSDKWDMTWCDRATGKVRAVFDSPQVSDGDAVFRALVWRDEYKEVYGTPPTDMTAVVVFRHQGISLAMNDEYWDRFKIGEKAKVHAPDGKKWATSNPVSKAAPDMPPQFANYTLPNLISSGGIVLACNLAFSEAVVGKFKADGKISDDEARKQALAHLVPGVILQPSGVFAALRAQQAGCSYFLAS